MRIHCITRLLTVVLSHDKFHAEITPGFGCVTFFCFKNCGTAVSTEWQFYCRNDEKRACKSRAFDLRQRPFHSVQRQRSAGNEAPRGFRTGCTLTQPTGHMLWMFPSPSCLLFHAAQIKTPIDSSWALCLLHPCGFMGSRRWLVLWRREQEREVGGWRGRQIWEEVIFCIEEKSASL